MESPRRVAYREVVAVIGAVDNRRPDRGRAERDPASEENRIPVPGGARRDSLRAVQVARWVVSRYCRAYPGRSDSDGHRDQSSPSSTRPIRDTPRAIVL